jgi:hypothetical protein
MKTEDRIKAFLEDYNKTTQELSARHTYEEKGQKRTFQIIPQLKADDHSINAVFGVGNVNIIEAKIDKKNEKRKEPKTD